MNLALAEEQLPVRLRFESPMTDDQLLHFCAANDVWRVERESNGEIVLKTPTGFGGSNMNVRFSPSLTNGLSRMGEAQPPGRTVVISWRRLHAVARRGVDIVRQIEPPVEAGARKALLRSVRSL